jgi:hypothetical protein
MLCGTTSKVCMNMSTVSMRSILIRAYHHQLTYGKVSIPIFCAFFVFQRDALWCLDVIGRGRDRQSDYIIWPPIPSHPLDGSYGPFRFIPIRGGCGSVPITPMFMDQSTLRVCFDMYADAYTM